MKRFTLVVLCVALVLSAAPLFARKAADHCDPAGTWYGFNRTFDQQILVTVIPMGDGSYSVVADDDSNGPFPPWQRGSSWRGQISHLKGKKYDFRQILMAGPAAMSGKGADLFGASGTLRMRGCNNFIVRFNVGGIWAWGQTPLVDEPMLDMLADIPGHVMIGKYTRMPE